MSARPVVPTVIALACSLVIVGCGGSNTKTVTKTVTRAQATTVTKTTVTSTTAQPTDEPNTPADDCSGSDVHAGLARQSPSLPSAVDATRADIFNTARTCNFAGLVSVAQDHGAQLKFTYGTSTDAAAYWRSQEAKGERPLGVLALVLNTPYAKDRAGDYVWPAVAAKDTPTDADWTTLTDIYPAPRIATYRRAGSYYGWRVGITPTGTWSFFLQGD